MTDYSEETGKMLRRQLKQALADGDDELAGKIQATMLRWNRRKIDDDAPGSTIDIESPRKSAHVVAWMVGALAAVVAALVAGWVLA